MKDCVKKKRKNWKKMFSRSERKNKMKDYEFFLVFYVFFNEILFIHGQISLV